MTYLKEGKLVHVVSITHAEEGYEDDDSDYFVVLSRCGMIAYRTFETPVPMSTTFATCVVCEADL